jgi:hypothetical protein
VNVVIDLELESEGCNKRGRLQQTRKVATNEEGCNKRGRLQQTRKVATNEKVATSVRV